MLGQREYASGLTCPQCKGGGTGERSMTAGRKGLELRARCWRNKCGWWGRWDLMDVGGLPHPRASTAGTHGARYALDTLPLADATRDALEARYAVTAASLRRYGLRQSAGARAAYCPVQGPAGGFRGWVRRWLDGTKPKVKSYPADGFADGEAWQAWFHPPGGLFEKAQGEGLVVCVEDVFSAMRLAQVGIPAVSLLGISLSPTKVAELRQYAGTIVVALDEDAYGRAIDYGLRYMVTVRRLDTDIKDMTTEQLDLWTNCLFSSLRLCPPVMPAQLSEVPPLSGTTPG